MYLTILRLTQFYKLRSCFLVSALPVEMNDGATCSAIEPGCEVGENKVFNANVIKIRKGIHNGAFTLIELLVMISTMTILAAILFPVFAQAKETAKKTSCLSNVKQMTLAAILYTTDYNDTFAPTYYTNGSKIFSHWLSRNSTPSGIIFEKEGILTPYARSIDVTGCPSETGLVVENDGSFSQDEVEKVQGLLALSCYGSLDMSSTSIWEIPAETVMLLEVAKPDEWRWGTPMVGLISVIGGFHTIGGLRDQTMSMYYLGRNMTQARHRGFSNVGWMDGHAKSHKLLPPDFDSLLGSFTRPGYTRAYYKRWNFGFLTPPGLMPRTGSIAMSSHVINDPKANNYFLPVKVR